MTKLQGICIAKKWSSEDLAKKLGISTADAKHMLETGIIGPNEILMLTEILDMEVGDILG